MTKEEYEEHKDVIAAEEKRVESRMAVQEIFEAGFKRGLSKAGLTEKADWQYLEWLLERAV